MTKVKYKIAFFLLSCALFFSTSAFAAQTETQATVQQVCSQIYKGDFTSAGNLLAEKKKIENPYIGSLTNIISEYETIDKNRQAGKEAAYAERLAEVEKLRDWADSNDANDVNDISKVLSAVARTCEFADQQQKEQLLSETFVKNLLQTAQNKSTEFEAEGKWLDAYLICYNWLQAIYPDNQQYSDYGQRLVEMAEIASSFQDSPCETASQRYEGMQKKMFIRAIDVLNSNYVSLLNYRQMATKAISRCQLLAEVMNKAADTNSVGQTEKLNTENLGTWAAALTEISNEAKQSPLGISKNEFIDVFEKVLALNQKLGGAPKAEPQNTLLPQGVLIAQFAEAALAVLDPYTVMIWPKSVSDFEKAMTNEFTGIGIEISKPKGLLTVVSLLPDTPAYNSGLDAGDVIEAVDGVGTKDMSLTCAVKSITGQKGTKVTLTVKRQGQEETADITITRAKITVPTIRGWKRTETGKWLYFIDDNDKIAYVRLSSFSSETASDLEEVLSRLEAEGLRALILDLRFNTGGLLNSAAEVTDKFIKEGLIVKTQPRFGIPSWEFAHRKKTHLGYPLIALINSYSASASEIVAGALADPKHNRAILVGSRTHGKGSVQGITHYPGEGAQLKYTMAYYHLPSGQRVESRDEQKKTDTEYWGIAPNIEVKLRSDEITEMSKVQRDNNVLVKADHDREATPLKKHTAEETIAADAQLAVGILVAKTKLTEQESKTARAKNAKHGIW